MTVSLLNRDESAAIKGLLMLLILVGHDALLMSDPLTGSEIDFKGYLYSFHVYCFFILPWLYGYNPTSPGGGVFYMLWNDALKYAKRVLVPYAFWCVILLAINTVVNHQPFDSAGTLKAFFSGNEKFLKEFFGAGFIWFLPAYFSLSLIRSIWHNSGRMVHRGIIILSAMCWVLMLFVFTDRYELFSFSFLALIQGLSFTLFYFIIRPFLRKIQDSKYAAILVFALFIIASISFFIRWKSDFFNRTEFYILVMTPLAFLCLSSIRKYLANSGFLRLIGKYSLEIYLLQMFIYNLINSILLHFFSQTVVLGFVSFAITLSACLVGGILLNRIPYLRTVMFGKFN